jgi:TonB family protein
MAPSLRAFQSPLEASQHERQAIARLTLAFIAVSFAVHWLIGAAYHPFRLAEPPAPQPTQFVTIDHFWTPTPSPPVTRTPTPAPAKDVDSTPRPSTQVIKPVESPPITRPQPTDPGGVPQPLGSATPAGVGPTDTSQLPPASPAAEPTFAPCRIVRKVEPQYPDIVKAGGFQGTVAVVLTIGPNGEALSVRVGESSGNRALDDAAVAAARASTYWCPPAAGREAELYQVIYRFVLDQ